MCLDVGHLAGDIGWEWLIVGHVPALRVQPLPAPLTLSNRSSSVQMSAQASAGRKMQFRLRAQKKKRSIFAAFGAASPRYSDADWRHYTRACGSVQDGKRQTTYR